MAKMIDIDSMIETFKEHGIDAVNHTGDETYEDGYNFATMTIKVKGSWAADALDLITQINQANGSFNDFDRGVRDAVNELRKEKGL